MTQIIEFFKALIFFTIVTFVQVNIISWLFAFPISVAFSYCSFTMDSETKGVEMQLYIGGLEIVTCSLDLNGIHKDVNLEILPRGEQIIFSNYSLPKFEFDIDIVVRKHFDDLSEDDIRKARNIIKNYVNVYKMILQQ